MKSRPTDQRLNALGIGDFGKSVLRHLSAIDTNITQIWLRDRSLFDLSALTNMLNVVIGDADLGDLLLTCNDECYRRGIRLLPVIHDHSSLRVGPLINPGNGPCWACWKHRTEQHGASPNEAPAQACGEKTLPSIGFLAPASSLAAAALVEVYNRENAGSLLSGTVYHLSLLSGHRNTSQIVGIHGCSKCGLDLPTRDRSTTELHKHLTFLWSPQQRDGAGDL
jgi:bacteriocin biosynthesis cyclodehydratase domain-containing protein